MLNIAAEHEPISEVELAAAAADALRDMQD